MRSIIRSLAIPAILLGPAVFNVSYSLLISVGFPPIEDLAIDASPFPAGWEADPPDTDFPPAAPCSSGSPVVEYLDRRYRHVGDPGTGAFLRLERYRSTGSAEEWYERDSSVAFREAEWNTGWDVPQAVSFESPFADQYRFGCTLEGSPELRRPECAYIAQYGLYVLEFYVDFTATSGFSYPDLQRIYQAIDHRFVEASSLR